MESGRKTPRDIARSLAQRDRQARQTRTSASSARSSHRTTGSLWKRETFTLPRQEARAKAREWFGKFPKAAYMTEIEFWREISGDQIEFTIRRLPSAD